MNWTQIEGRWQQLKEQLRARWGKLLENVAGKKEQLVGTLQIATTHTAKPPAHTDEPS